MKKPNFKKYKRASTETTSPAAAAVSKRPSAAEILAHTAYPDAVWKLLPTQEGKLNVAAGRGGPVGIDWEVHGTGRKKIVLIVGLGGVKWAWQRQLLEFGHEKGEEYSVLVNDNRGIGKSDKPLARYTTDGMAKDLLEVIDHLGWTQQRELNIVGVSMGGMIAQELAYQAPTRINSLSLFSTAAAIENTTTFYQNMINRIQMFIPKSMDATLIASSNIMFAQHWLDAPDNAIIPSTSTPGVEFPVDPTTKQPRAYKKFSTNYERWAAQELTKKLDKDAFGKKGFMLQAIAAGWHHKSPEQLKKLGDEVGRERIVVVHGEEDHMIGVLHGRKLIEYLQPGMQILKGGVGHVFFMEEMKWHNELMATMIEKGEKLNGESAL